jgi:para-aminobenzoate synthetase / 4-amino-4-deoxychorismate lyase
VPGPLELGAMTARPYRLPLLSNASPGAVIAQLREADRPGALWGDWFDGGLLIFRRPLQVEEPVAASDGFIRVDEQPQLESGAEVGSGIVAGGWLACFGYDPKTTTLAFYDSLLRWQRDNGWSFESLGLRGRELENSAALQHWTAMLQAAPSAPIRPPQVGPFSVSTDAESARDGYLAAVEDVINRIDHGRFYQLNLCIRLHAGVGSSAPVVFGHLCEQLQPAFGGLITGPLRHGPPRMITSFSPELFLRIRDRTVLTAPIKGTAPRGADDGATALRASAKDAAENVMIVDLMRNDLSRVCLPGTVAVQELLTIQPHPGVWHLVSAIRGDLNPEITTAQVLAAAFPPGSVTGAPKISAQRGIADLEVEPRGAYTGSIGLVSPIAGADFNVIIRTFELHDGHLELGVGGGITVDSVPIREWYECLHKAAPLVAAAGSAFDEELVDEPAAPEEELLADGVFESILVVRGKIIRLAAHLARLDRSCRELYRHGIPDDLAGAAHQLASVHADQDRLAIRVLARPREGRLDLSLDARPLGARPHGSILSYQSRPDRSWRHKWIERSALAEAEVAASPAQPFFTARARPHDITETSRGNLFIQDQNGFWCTPPLDEQVLPGVTRREVLDLLADRRTPARIRRCSVQELRQSRGAFWTSSLSGAVPITAVDGTALPDVSEFTAELNEQLGVC